MITSRSGKARSLAVTRHSALQFAASAWMFFVAGAIALIGDLLVRLSRVTLPLRSDVIIVVSCGLASLTAFVRRRDGRHDSGLHGLAGWAGLSAVIAAGGMLAMKGSHSLTVLTTTGLGAAACVMAVWSVATWGRVRQPAAPEEPASPDSSSWSSETLIATALDAQEDQRMLEYKAMTDPLTGLGNRHMLDLAVQRLPADGRPFSVMLVDMDKFKAVNDTLGHDVGDALLKMIATVLQSGMRHGDVLARTGGDEFVALLPGTRTDGAVIAASRILAQLERAIEVSGVDASISIGIAESFGADHYAAVAAKADTAMYEAKRSGGKCWKVADSSQPSPQPA